MKHLEHASELLAETANCAYCPTLCLHACPVSTAERSDVVSPWGKMSLTRWLASGRAELTPDSAEVLYKCTGCEACADACRHAVPVAETLRIARQDAIDAGVVVYEESRFEVPVEMPGAATLPVGVSGYRLHAAGHAAAFRRVAERAVERWQQRATLIFAAAEDLRCVRETYPELGLSTPRAMLVSERPAPRQAPRAGVAYHEACHIARGEGIDRGAIRANAAAMTDAPLIELRWQGKTATCCGGGGAYPETSPDGAREAARRILTTAVARGASFLVTGCSRCAAHLSAHSDGLAIEVLTAHEA